MTEFGVSLPTIGMDDPSAVRLVAEQAEASGLDSVWAADHIVLPVSHSSTYPYSADGEFLIAPGLPFLDQFTTLSYVAGFTSRVKLGTAVTLLPLRHPLAVAKTVATLDVLSGGRSILGVAAGWLREEFEALGLDFESRGKVLDESLDVLMAAWTESVPRFEGRFFNVSGVESYPHPVQSPHPPIWVGGHTRPVMRRRREIRHGVVPAAVRHDAGVACCVSSAHQRGGGAAGARRERGCIVAARARRSAERAGHGGRREAQRARRRAGTHRETLAGYADVGVSHFVFLPQARSLADVQRTVDLLTEKVIPLLRMHGATA